VDDERAWRSTLRGVLAPPRAPRFRLLGPVHAEHRVGSADAASIGGRLREPAGFDLVVLRKLALVDDREAGHRQALYVVEPRQPATAPLDGAGWLGRSDLADLDLPAALRPPLEAWLAEAEGAPTPPERRAWARPGWFAEAAAWTAARLAEAGRPPTGPIEQLRSWSISALLRAETESGAVYFKAVPPLMAAEPSITRGLSERFPDRVPSVLAVDVERAWMLVEHAGEPIQGKPEPALRERVLRAIGEMQRASADRLDELIGLGCADRRLAHLAGQIDLLLAEAGPISGASAETIAALRAEAPRIRALCAELEAAGPPPTLVHGDLHHGNVAVRDGQPVIFDWTDACVAHPFLDLATLFDDDEEPTPELADAYLASFRDFAPPARLRDALRLGRTLGALHQAVSYHLIVRSCEPSVRSDWSGALDDWLPYLCRRVREHAGR
jgi:hypothetical protein